VKYNLIITAVAEKHIVSACNYYETQQSGLSERFLAELQTACKKISANPYLYSYISANPNDKFRDVKLYKFPFVVICEVSENDVIVVAVFNTDRNPLLISKEPLQ
jgi:plasmid stabilization system protein ParE